jgi:catechol 2,3-dioxygenase-like lactoylglutathione lyase family enzyme
VPTVSDARSVTGGSRTAFEVRGIDHVDITAPKDLEADVLAWYESVLGLERVAKPNDTPAKGGWFLIGELQLHVTRAEHNPHPRAHFGIEVDDYEAVVQRLREVGCHIEQAHPIVGLHRFYTRDPAGNRIEILSYDEESPD